MERVHSNEMRPSSKTARQFIEESRFAKVILKLVGVFGVSLVMSGMFPKPAFILFTDSWQDGVLTPAQSVLGAIQG